ncbi:MAG TPA: lysophospholipase [Gemmatimonadales bacterium]|jgi:alpha-beta hydrolase superfamily lysophospholipase
MNAIATHTENRFAGRGGIDLFRQSWRPSGAPKAVVVNLHGLGDHSGLYPTLVDHLVGREMVVQSFDLRGNGRSAGARGYIEQWRDYRDDLAGFLALATRDDPGRPLFLLGNSLGGLIALEFALQSPAGLRGVIAVSAPLGRLNVPAPLLLAGRMMSKVWPGFSLETGLDLSGLARDSSVAEAIVSDPYFHRRGTARLSTEVTAAIARVRAGAGTFAFPLLLLHGSDDRMVSPDGSRVFATEAASPDKQLIEYPGAYHALFADFGREQVLADLAGWIEARL